MAITVQTLTREFNYNGTKLADPDPSMSVADVQAMHSGAFPELATAKPHVETKETAHGPRQIVTFTVAVGTKG